MTDGQERSLAGDLAALLAAVGLSPALADRVTFDGIEPAGDVPLRLGEAAAVALGACAAAVAELWERRGGEPQTARIDVAHAAASLAGWAQLRIDGEPLEAPHLGNPVYDAFPCADGRWLQLQAGLPNLVERTLRVLGCGHDREQIAAAVARRPAAELEQALADGDACGAVVRTAEEWALTEQGRALAGVPLVAVERIADADPERLPAADRPLAGVRVLDLTRVIAGPIHGRTLAEHGASVLQLIAPSLPNVLSAALDTGMGKRSAFLDVRIPAQRDQLRRLAARCDVFAQGYRPGALASHGFDARELAALRPGIVFTSMSCFGFAGPWSGRRGWEQIAQAATGLALLEDRGDVPKLLPAAACDYITGYLGAFGTVAALLHREASGGTHRVDVSLCRTGMWLLGLGPPARREPTASDDGAWTTETPTAYGRLRHLRPVARMTATPTRWTRPVEPPGTSEPVWDGPEDRDGSRA